METMNEAGGRAHARPYRYIKPPRGSSVELSAAPKLQPRTPGNDTTIKHMNARKYGRDDMLKLMAAAVAALRVQIV